MLANISLICIGIWFLSGMKEVSRYDDIHMIRPSDHEVGFYTMENRRSTNSLTSTTPVWKGLEQGWFHLTSPQRELGVIRKSNKNPQTSSKQTKASPIAQPVTKQDGSYSLNLRLRSSVQPSILLRTLTLKEKKILLVGKPNRSLLRIEIQRANNRKSRNAWIRNIRNTLPQKK